VPARVTLHAAFPQALADPAVAALVRACAEETAEIQGVPTPDVTLFDDRIELDGEIPTPVLLAIAAEVRRATGRWHIAKHGSALWRGE
jgi:hypothetical protein